MDSVLVFGIVAGLLHLTASWLYNKRIFRGEIVPNTATWALWVFLTILSASSYAVMTGDMAKYIPTIASAIGTIFICIISLFSGKFKSMEPWEIIILLVGIVSGIVWWIFQSATYANLIVVFAETIAFIPLYRKVWKDPTVERPLPWCVWSMVYPLMIYIVIFHWNGHYQDLVYPVAMLCTHPTVALLTLRKPRRDSQIYPDRYCP
jgi:hypothetical protein